MINTSIELKKAMRSVLFCAMVATNSRESELGNGRKTLTIDRDYYKRI